MRGRQEGMIHSTPIVRPIQERDFPQWKPLWDGYNAFYGRYGATALPGEITQETWRRFFDPNEPVFALVAELDGQVAGLAHYLFHRSTTRIEDSCYLQDLFTAAALRGRGVARALILALYERAAEAGSSRVYWQTQHSNSAARLLYDKVGTHAGFIVYSHQLK
jgi:GNAT superfamily N-acetyltransferase